MNKEPLNVYGRQCVRTMLIDFARSENLEISMEEKDGWFNVRFRTARGTKEFNILWSRCENAWNTVNTVIKHARAWMEKYDCDSESKRHLELGTAFADGFEAGITCKRSDVEKAVREEVRKAIDLVIKKIDIDEWSKMPPYLAQQQIYLTTARGGGKTWYYEQWRKFMEELEKEPKVKPFSRYDDEAVKYMKEYVKMTNQMYEEWIKRNLWAAPTNVKNTLPEIKNVIFNEPATIVIWEDGTKTVVQCRDGDIYDPEKGLAMAISKKILGNKHDYYHTFKHWMKRYKKPEETTEVTCYVDGMEFTKTVWTNEEDR